MDPYFSSIIYAESFDWISTLIYSVIIIILLVFSAFFSKCETVFSCASKAKLMTLVDENQKGARKALWLSENYDRVLSVILVGNNLVNIAISTLGLRLFLGQHPQTRPQPGRHPGHRRHHLHGVPQAHREGFGP